MSLIQETGVILQKQLHSIAVVLLLYILIVVSVWYYDQRPSEWRSNPGLDVEAVHDSCSSRSYQQHHWRHRTSHQLSPALLSSWKTLDDMHSFCSLAAARLGWEQLLRDGDLDGTSLVLNGSTSCKYLFFSESDTGLGNRILALVSALVYALATNRTIFIDSRQTFATTLCEPFSNSSWLLPDGFPYWLVDAARPLGAAVDAKFKNVNLVHLYLDHLQSEGDKMFFCQEHQEALNRVTSLAWTSNQYQVTSFFMVPGLWEKLVSLFGGDAGYEVFGHVAALAVSPVNDIWKSVAAAMDEKRDLEEKKTGKLLGLQIRPHFSPNITAFDPVVSKALFNCLVEQRLLPDPSSSGSNNSNKIEVLVASLQGKYLDFLRDVYRKQADSRVSFTSLSQLGQEQHTLEQHKQAMIEMWLLGLSDDIVASQFSTFGYIAHGLFALKPLYLGLFGLNWSCYKSNSSQPCTQFPQSPTCQLPVNRNSKHRDWLSSHVRPCVDFPPGSQLVP